MKRRKRSLGEKLRYFSRNFVYSPGLRDAIQYSKVREYFQFKRHFKTLFEKENEGPFEYTLVAVAIIKDEGRYLAEWLEYHKLVGIEKFYLYENGSSDNSAEVLAPYVENGYVEVIEWPGIRMQISAYNDALEKLRFKSQWISFLDADEFIVPLQKETIPEILEDYKNEVGLSAHWLIYGDNGLTHYDERPLIERFTAHAPELDRFVKTIINPRAAFLADIHRACFVGSHAAVNENRKKVRSQSKSPTGNIIRINHYWGKTLDEFQAKSARGMASDRNASPNIDFFHRRNRNEVQDTTMEKYVPLVKENMKKTRETWLARQATKTEARQE